MFETIVVSVDGSEPSSHALSTAVDIAKRYGARLTILHAVMDDAPLSSLIEVAERNGFMDQITAELDEATSIKPVPVPITAAPLVAIPEELLGKIGSLLLEKSVSQARALGLEEVETALLGEDAAHEVPTSLSAAPEGSARSRASSWAASPTSCWKRPPAPVWW
jgi:nucleotide-binding universal stress UspA family protein